MKSNNFIQRWLVGALTFLKDSIFAQELASKNGFLQSLDPRIKIISFLLLILYGLFTRSILSLALLYLFCLILVLFSGFGLGYFLKRTWVFIPLFSLFIALPAFFGPGEVLLSGNFLGIKLTVSRQGFFAAVIFVARVVNCVSWVVLLNLTTKHFLLLKSLRVFKVPQIFVMLLGVCLRYIYLFVGIIQDTYLAITSRLGCGVRYQKGQELVAWNIAALWQRSAKLNAQVYNAMLARGYQGESLSWDDYQVRARDYLWLSAVITIIWIIRFLN